MGSITAATIMTKAEAITLDETGVRWPLPELCGWINDGQREVVLQKPSALSVNTAINLTLGTRQVVPDTTLGLLRLTRNLRAAPAGTTDTAPRLGGRAIRIVSREVLDTQSAMWHDETVYPPAREAKHYVFDEQDPYHFYVYPPNDGTGVVEAILAGRPSDIVVADGADPNDIASYTQILDLPDIYANAVLDYVLYRAYLKDAQFAGNGQRASLYYQQFANSLGMKVRLDVALSPNEAAHTVAS